MWPQHHTAGLWHLWGYNPALLAWMQLSSEVGLVLFCMCLCFTFLSGQALGGKLTWHRNWQPTLSLNSATSLQNSVASQPDDSASFKVVLFCTQQRRASFLLLWAHSTRGMWFLSSRHLLPNWSDAGRASFHQQKHMWINIIIEKRGLRKRVSLVKRNQLSHQRSFKLWPWRERCCDAAL